jgi:hypothetical protein
VVGSLSLLTIRLGVKISSTQRGWGGAKKFKKREEKEK